ncbi:hypothetical protein Pint_11398 [Pistacia integerrima]|uniref:Uncharacterized protein n=1 Tax=Pistacia integerrima TaxID=434235 RepID=A0ACC0XJQ1_9ROSI|nr:hypothetical protein Pint_11398 [Pistacia integerrima]
MRTRCRLVAFILAKGEGMTKSCFDSCRHIFSMSHSSWLLIDLWAMVMRSPLGGFVFTQQGLLVQLPPATNAIFIGRCFYPCLTAFLFDDLPLSGAVPFSRSECDLCVALEVRGGVGKEVVASARADRKRELDTMRHALHEKEWAY